MSIVSTSGARSEGTAWSASDTTRLTALSVFRSLRAPDTEFAFVSVSLSAVRSVGFEAVSASW